MNHCTKVQERVALGEPLSEPDRVHLSNCERCSLVAETYSLLDASLDSLAEPVPEGFADRVMSRLAALEVDPSKRWFDARWAELALANVALLCALLNTVRFLAGILVPTVSFGGAP
jgi:hypothetical protein